MDDLLEGVITNKYKPEDAVKPVTELDQMVQDEWAKANKGVKKHKKKVKKCDSDDEDCDEEDDKPKKKKMTQEEEWADLMKQPDPLADTDIYATEHGLVQEEDEEPKPAPVDPDQTEMEDDLNDLLATSFKKEQKRSSFVSNIPELIQKKKSDNYQKLFKGVSENDIESMDV